MAGPAGYALDLRGRPQIVGQGRPRGVAAWLTLRRAASCSPRVHQRRSPSPLRRRAWCRRATTRRSSCSKRDLADCRRVAVALRLGIIVDVRGAGRVVRRIDIRAVRVRRAGAARTLEVVLTNRGNVSELVTARRLSVVLRRKGRLVGTLRPAPQTLLPRATGLVDLLYRGKARGPVTAIVRLSATNGESPRLHRFPLRL